MTNIMAAVKGEYPNSSGKFDSNVGIVVADGLGSDGVEKTGGFQKLFSVGESFLLCSGMSDILQYIAGEIIKEADKYRNPEAIAERIMEVMDKDVILQSGEGLGMIVAGKGDKHLEVYSIRPHRFRKPIFRTSGNAFDGSGARFVAGAFERDRQKGFMSDPVNDTLADLTLRFFDFGYAATKSAGVNEELQYGFFLGGKSAALFHPHVSQAAPSREYCNENGEFSPGKAQENQSFYKDLTRALAEMYNMHFDFNMMASQLRDGTANKPEAAVEEMQRKVAEIDKARQKVNTMIEAYVGKHNTEPKPAE